MPHNLSIIRPGSRCGRCKAPIAWYDNIPLLSWLVLRGKCRHCGAFFSFRYWLVELLTGVLFLGVWLKYAHPNLAEVRVALDFLPPVIVPLYWLVLAGLIAATFIDLDHYIIPDEIAIGGTVVGLALSCIFPSLHGESLFIIGAYKSLLGILVGSGLVLWMSIIGEVIFKKEAMGFGDVKFMGMIGAFLGWEAAIFTLVASSFVGAFAGSLWIFLSKERRTIHQQNVPEANYHSLDSWSVRDEMDTHAMRSSIPYGPFLALGAALWIFVGDIVHNWYAPLFQLN